MSELQTITLSNDPTTENENDDQQDIKTELESLPCSGSNPSSSQQSESTNDTQPITTTVSLTPSNISTFEPGANLQKVVLEDIKLDEFNDYAESSEESTFRQFKFQILYAELKAMVDNSILDVNTVKPYRYLTGNFIKVFEKHVEVFEKMKVPIQKRNNIVYEESLRNNTVYLRINGDCKLCPKSNKVKYVFIIKQRPNGTEKFIDVDAKSRGVHNHNFLNEGGMSRSSRYSLSTSFNQNEKVLVFSKKRKNADDENCNGGNVSFGSVSPNGSSGSPSCNNGSWSRLNQNDKTLITAIANQITSKIMIKLDQINLKVNHISDRLYDLERKLETVEVADMQLLT